MPAPILTGRGRLVLLWGLGGVLLLLSQAILRLAHWTIEAFIAGMAPWQWALCIAWVLLQLYAEGHRGFHHGFSPRVVTRAYHLARHPRPLHVVFAPFYCMGLFHASRRRRVVSWALVTMIICLIVLVRMASQPWRGIIDAGVVAGLIWGVGSLLVHWAHARREDPGLPNDLPPSAAQAAATGTP